MNLKITVIKHELLDKYRFGWLVASSFSILVAFLIYIVYIMHWNSISIQITEKSKAKKTMQKRSLARFSHYQEVKVEYSHAHNRHANETTDDTM